MTGKAYKCIVLTSFLILIAVQLKLIYNTYMLSNRDFNLAEKKLLNDEYGKSIPSDKLYPGAGKIIDAILSRNMPNLRDSFLNNQPVFESLSQKICDTLFQTLRIESNMDSVFRSIIKRNALDSNLQYVLTFQSIEINFDQDLGNIYIYNSQQNHSLTNLVQGDYGIEIAGSLANPSPENRVTHLSVSGKLLYDYRITFNLFIDRPNRIRYVAYQMLPTFSLVSICILITVGINYYTYANWMKQKKEAAIKADFLNSIKHEFNTPITTILVAAKSLVDEEILVDRNRIKSLASMIERQARRLQTHINQMLEISMMEKKLNLVETELNYVIMALVNDYEVKLQEQDKLTFDPYESDIFVLLDLFVFTTMLNNILDNAFKHNDCLHKKAEIFIDDQKEHVRLHIKDNGSGIKEEAKSKIFDKFYRANEDSSVPGLGLGLHYVKECLDIHDWTMEVQTSANLGTEFIVYIPKISIKPGSEK